MFDVAEDEKNDERNGIGIETLGIVVSLQLSWARDGTGTRIVLLKANSVRTKMGNDGRRMERQQRLYLYLY
jgi:hypothetical protein